METMWAQGSSPSFYGMSVVDGALVAKPLGDKLRGLATSQVVPWPWSQVDRNARAFREQCQAAGLTPDYATYEG